MINRTGLQLHLISSHGEVHTHYQAEILLVTDSQSEYDREREKGEKRDSIVQALGKVTVFPRKDQVQVSRETNPKTSRQTLAKRHNPMCGCVYAKTTKRSIFLQVCISIMGKKWRWRCVLGVLSAKNVQCQTTDKKTWLCPV